MKNFVLGILSTLLVLAVVGVAYVLLAFAEVRADLPSSTLEAAFMKWAAHAPVRRSGMLANGKWDSDEKRWKAAAFLKRIKSLPPSVSAALEQKSS